MDDYAVISKGDLKSFEQFLLESRYGASYREELAVMNQTLLGRIESAIAKGTCQELNHIKQLAKGEPGVLLEVLFARGDILNCRLVLRAMSTGTISGPPPRWHSYGAIGESFYSDIWRQSSSLMETIQKCYSKGHPFAVALADSLLDLDKGFELQQAERTFLLGMLDQLWKTLDHFSSSNVKRVRDFLGMTIDVWNMGIWIRRRAGYPDSTVPSPMFIRKGAWLDVDTLSRSRVMTELVHGSPWRKVIRGIEESTPRDFQRALSVYMWKWQLQLFRTNPLGIEVAIGYMARQLVEWENLNLLSVGMAMEIAPEDLMARLIPI